MLYNGVYEPDAIWNSKNEEIPFWDCLKDETGELIWEDCGYLNRGEKLIYRRHSIEATYHLQPLKTEPSFFSVKSMFSFNISAERLSQSMWEVSGS